MSGFADAIRLPSAKFPEVGTTVEGVVADISEAPVPHFNASGRIEGNEVDEDGNERTQLDVVIDTAQGKRVIHTGGSIFYAIGRALAEIGAEDLEVGDSLSITYSGDGEQKTKGRNAPKQYTATVVQA